jgi:hypothetical protein
MGRDLEANEAWKASALAYRSDLGVIAAAARLFIGSLQQVIDLYEKLA